MAVLQSDVCDEAPFRIEAGESFREPRTRILKHADTFAVLNTFGDIVAERGGPDGIYHRDTRFLSQLELRLNGRRLLFLSSAPVGENSLLQADLANPDTLSADGTKLRSELIYLNRRQFIWQSSYYELLLIRNFDLRRHAVTLDIRFASDFADIFEVRGQHRPRRGKGSVQIVSPETAALRYRGLDGVERVTTLCFSPAPNRLDNHGARFVVDLAAGRGCRLALRVSCDSLDTRPWDVRQFYRALRSEQHALHDMRRRFTRVEGSDPIFNELIHRSTSDLSMLSSPTGQGLYPYAGIPWFCTPFGRDGLITALLTLAFDPMMAKGVLGFLAATQGTEYDKSREEEPGKILHEMRSGEMARLGEVPFGRYYGTVDATPLFVLLMGEYFARTGDLDTVQTLWPNVMAALRWIDNEGDPDRDGFVEYRRQGDTGLVNQGWKDSDDSIFHADGELAKGPIALCEVQAYVFAAKRHAAALARALGSNAIATRLEIEAEALREKFEAAFWCNELSTYALALDGDKRPCRVVASNAGHVLLSGIAAPDRAGRVSETLMSVSCFSGWGIRTVARTARRYNPISYHNGSVWPHDNALIALGFARYGLKGAVSQLFKGLFDASTYWEPRRLPELFCGFARRHTAPTRYPVACSPQAWASASMFGLLQASLGLGFNPAAGEIRFDAPVLPDLLERLHVRGLRLGETGADVLLQRIGGNVAATVTQRSGSVRIVVTH